MTTLLAKTDSTCHAAFEKQFTSMLATSLKHAVNLQDMKNEGADKFMESFDFVYLNDAPERIPYLKLQKLKKRTKKQQQKDVAKPAVYTLAPSP
jgi:6-pyruvoyl-tetrahydropterin synthase